uniref:Kazal-like domain-containing protein n=1 Tax=Haemonchus contortus TaxID=6289 RepID=A0A7I4YS45_HAECO|nr:unnamed protein product [Haemonchus contortus]
MDRSANVALSLFTLKPKQQSDMLLLLISILVACSTARIPYLCTEIRFETEQEAERRRIFEHCTEVCDENGRTEMPCSNCQIPYEGYGCLRQRREVAMACILDCDLLLPDHMAQAKCLQTCHNAKSLHFL